MALDTERLELSEEKRGVAFDQRFPLAWADRREWPWMRMVGVDGAALLAAARAAGDREGERRGLVLDGEHIEGQEVVRRYRRPTWQRRLRLALGLRREVRWPR